MDVDRIAALTGQNANSGGAAEALPVKRRRRRPRRVRRVKPGPRRGWKRRAVLRAVTKQNTLLAAMQPGRWYARADLAALVAPAISYDYVKRKVVYFRGRGWIEQADVPGWRPPADPWRGAAWTRYLFRLTPEGEAARRLAMMLL